MEAFLTVKDEDECIQLEDYELVNEHNVLQKDERFEKENEIILRDVISMSDNTNTILKRSGNNVASSSSVTAVDSDLSNKSQCIEVMNVDDEIEILHSASSESNINLDNPLSTQNVDEDYPVINNNLQKIKEARITKESRNSENKVSKTSLTDLSVSSNGYQSFVGNNLANAKRIVYSSPDVTELSMFVVVPSTSQNNGIFAGADEIIPCLSTQTSKVLLDLIKGYNRHDSDSSNSQVSKKRRLDSVPGISTAETTEKENIADNLNAFDSNPKIYECHLCDFTSELPKALKVHIKYLHPNPNLFACEDCEFTAFLIENVRKHVILTHKKEFFYKCKQCSYKTTNKGSFTLHVKKHKCQWCTFRTSNVLEKRDHIREKHPNFEILNLENTMYDCYICDFRSYNKYTIKNHRIDVHCTPKTFKCKLCSFETVKEDYLKIHLEQNLHKSVLSSSKTLSQNKIDIVSDIDVKNTISKGRGFAGPKDNLTENCSEDSPTTNGSNATCSEQNVTVNIEHSQDDCDPLALDMTEVDNKVLLNECESGKEANARIIKAQREILNCEFCSFTNASKLNLQKHRKNQHMRNNYFRCALCSYKSFRKDHAVSHMRRIHKLYAGKAIS